jgi:anti-sigma factor RsiW
VIHIDRHNYETFFLLYVDGELSVAEKQAVMQFVQENPDLGAELDQLRDAVLTPDNSFFSGKESLYRNANEEITPANCESHFLLYVDEELTVTGREAVERFVLQHPAEQNNFTLLKQTKLPQESVVFPDKSILYRKEQSEKPVVVMRWWRLAAAAALLGTVVIGGILFNQDSLPGRDGMLANNTAKGNNNNAAATNRLRVPEAVTANNSEAIADQSVTKDAAKTATAAHAVLNDEQQKQLSSVPVQEAVMVPEKPVLNIRPQDIIVAAVEQQNTNAVTDRSNAQISKMPNHAIINESDMVAPDKEIVADNSNSYAKNVVYKELDTESDSNNKSLLLGSLEINKDKLRGFFRKASSIFRGKNKQEDERTESGAVNPISRSLK